MRVHWNEKWLLFTCSRLFFAIELKIVNTYKTSSRAFIRHAVLCRRCIYSRFQWVYDTKYPHPFHVLWNFFLSSKTTETHVSIVWIDPLTSCRWIKFLISHQAFDSSLHYNCCSNYTVQVIMSHIAVACHNSFCLVLMNLNFLMQLECNEFFVPCLILCLQLSLENHLVGISIETWNKPEICHALDKKTSKL